MARGRGRTPGTKGRNRSVMQHRFSEVPNVEVPRSQLDRSFGHKTTFDAGFLIPVFVDEALPGDTFNLSMTAFARLATPIKPIMDNMFLDSFYFSVPLRLVWDNFERFMGAQDNPDDSTDFTVPQITNSQAALTTGSIYDYMGLPINDATLTSTIDFNALHLRAYNLIWNEWFRDQNMQDSVVIETDDGPDSDADYEILRRGKRHDYFTSCLPWPQKGDAVSLPLGTSAPIIGIGKYDQTYSAGPTDFYETDGSGSSTYVDYQWISHVSPTENMGVEEDPDHAGYPNIRADLTNATAATINELRQAFQVQKMLEKDARGGTRYTEKIRAHFGVTSPDARLQRPEYLGGGSTAINISPVTNTSGTTNSPDSNNPNQGDLAAIGTVSAHGHGFVHSFTEHCVVIGLVSVRADLTYQQGLERMWSRQTREDFYWPSLAHIGEQAVLTQEIYTTGVDAADGVVFGYQERYGEYRYKPSKISGLYRSGALDALGNSNTLDIWHLSQEFGSPPTLDDTFIVENPPVDRVIAVSTEPHFLFDSFFSFRCARPMPVFGVPGLIDHF